MENLFTLKNIKQILSKNELSSEYEYPAYSADSTNNGIVGYTNNPEFICDDETPVYITFGDHTRTMNIARKSFSVLDNVKVLVPIINNDNVLLFIIAIWQKMIPNLGYARHWKFAKNCILQLPTKNKEIDFDFMESFIAELEAERVAELSAYLKVSGLDNYELSSEEEKALQDFMNNKIVYGEFSYSKIFDHIKQGRRLKKEDQIPGKIPFVMAGTTNTGLVNYISNPVASFPKNSITIDIFGNTFYRNYSFGAGDDTGVYWNSKIEYSKGIMLFFASAMGKSIKGKFSYGKKLRSSQSYNFKMLLPINQGEIDFGFIENFICAIQKLVIKDVALYADSKISATKSVINKKQDK